MLTPSQSSEDDIISLGFKATSDFLNSLTNSIHNIETNLSATSSTLSHLTKRTRTQISLSLKLFKEQFEPLNTLESDAVIVLSLCCISENSNSVKIKEFLKDPPLFLCKMKPRLRNCFIFEIIGKTSPAHIALQAMKKVFPSELHFSLAALPSSVLQLKSPDSSKYIACISVSIPTVSPLLAEFLNHFHLTSPDVIDRFHNRLIPVTAFVYDLDTYQSHPNFKSLSLDDIDNLNIFLVPPCLYLDQLTISGELDSNMFATIYDNDLSSSGRTLIERIWKLTLTEDIIQYPSYDFTHFEFFEDVSFAHSPCSSPVQPQFNPPQTPPPHTPLQSSVNAISPDGAVTMGALIGLLQQMQANTTAQMQQMQTNTTVQMAQLQLQISASTSVQPLTAPIVHVQNPSNIPIDVPSQASDTSRQLAQYAILSQGKSRSGSSIAVSLAITAIAPLIPLFHSRDHIYEIFCPGENLALSLSLQLMQTSDLQAIGPFVSLDTFKRLVLERTFPDPEDESAPRSLSADTLVQLASLNFSKSADKNISIVCLQPEIGKATPTISSLQLCVRNLRKLLVTILGPHMNQYFLVLEDQIFTLCNQYSSSIDPSIMITAINLRLSLLRKAQSEASYSSPPTRITPDIISACLNINYLTAPDILQDQARRNAIDLKETKALVASLQAQNSVGFKTIQPKTTLVTPPGPSLKGISPCFRWINKFDTCKNTLVCANTPPRPHKFDVVDAGVKDQFEKWVRKYRISKK